MQYWVAASMTPPTIAWLASAALLSLRRSFVSDSCGPGRPLPVVIHISGNTSSFICCRNLSALCTGSLFVHPSPGYGPHMLSRFAPPRMPVTMLMN